RKVERAVVSLAKILHCVRLWTLWKCIPDLLADRHQMFLEQFSDEQVLFPFQNLRVAQFRCPVEECILVRGCGILVPEIERRPLALDHLDDVLKADGPHQVSPSFLNSAVSWRRQYRPSWKQVPRQKADFGPDPRLGLT